MMLSARFRLDGFVVTRQAKEVDDTDWVDRKASNHPTAKEKLARATAQHSGRGDTNRLPVTLFL